MSNSVAIECDEIEEIKQQNGSVISFESITYTIEQSTGCSPCCAKPKDKVILNNVSGIMKPGLNAIMGPTGSGKSSLLDILAKRKDPRWLSGSVLLNSKKLPPNYKYLSGYVVQNDILMGTLTVRESMWFSANLRLSAKTKHKQKKERIAEILEQLGLQKCADTKIGNEMIRGISGGERKRTSIGLELITKPSVLYLDEPTTGLDASTANTVIRLLKKIALQGQNIVISIHQPRFSIFRLFDSLTLLSLGECVYHGESDKALDYFSAIGYECETHNNPADFFLDVINGEVSSSTLVSEIDFDADSKHERDVKITKKLRDEYTKTQIFKDTEAELAKINHQKSSETKVVSTYEMYATGFLSQMKHLLGRDIKNVMRDPQGLLGNIVVNIVIGVVFGLLYFQVDNTPTSGTQNRFGLLFFIITNLLFSSTASVELFIKEKTLFIHEYVSGYYRIISFFASKLLADLIPMRTVSPLFYSITTYWMVGLKADAGAFFIFLLVTTLTGYASVGVGLFLSVTCGSFAVTQLFLILIFVFSIVFSGLLVNVDTILSWLSWIQYLSIARYGLVGVSIAEFKGQQFEQCYTKDELANVGNTLFSNMTVTQKGNLTCMGISGDSYLHEALSIGSSPNDITDWILWQNVVALACLSLGLFILTYIQLVRLNKYK